MNRPRLVRGLRILWSVWSGILCVLLVVLWVRSSWTVEVILFDIGGSRGVLGSVPGSFVIGFSENRWSPTWTRVSMPAEEWLGSFTGPQSPAPPSRFWGKFDYGP